MTSRAWCPIVVLSFALSSLSPAAAAFAQQPESIPLELASALLSFRAPGYGGPVEFLIGEAPADLDVEWPAGSRIVGAALWTARRTVVATVEGPTAEAIRALREDLEERGWTKRVEPPGRGGFQAASSARGSEMLCGTEGGFRTVFAVARPGGGSLLMLHTFDGDDDRDMRTPCDSPPEPEWRGPPDILPRIEPPPGTRLRLLGSGGGRASASSSAVIETELGVEALYEHLASQLEDAGWRPGLGGRAAGSSDGERDAAFNLWRFEEDGEPWRGELMVGRVPGTEDYEARLQAWKPGERS